jgi:hypothetical protein
MTTPRLRPAWQRLMHAAKEQLSLMGAAEQTRLSWAKSVRTLDDIPAAYHAYLNDHLPGPAACLPAVLTPTFRGFLRGENEKLVFIHDERLYILEQTPAGLLPAVFPVADINSIEVGAILLKAWLRVSGVIDGELKSATLKYNTVTQFLFDPLVARMRDALSDSPGTGNRSLEREKFAPLQEQYFKFMSYAQRSLMPGARVVVYTLQPEMRIPRLSVLGRSVAMRTIDTTHLCILTDSELIVIRDDPNSIQGCDDTRYGGIWDYLPLSRVRQATLQESDTGPALVLHLPGDDRFEVRFSSDSREQVERFYAQVQAGIQMG